MNCLVCDLVSQKSHFLCQSLPNILPYVLFSIPPFEEYLYTPDLSDYNHHDDHYLVYSPTGLTQPSASTSLYPMPTLSLL